MRDVVDDPERQTGSILSTRRMTRAYGGVTAVDISELDFARGEITALIGPNGAGKSTFFNMISGFERPDSGSWWFEGRDVSGLANWQIARLGLVRTFQLSRSAARLSVLENVCVAAQGQKGERLWQSPFPKLWRKQEEEIRARAEEIVGEFGLTKVKSLPAGDLSGGQARLLELARAVITKPTLLLLDEPMAGVAPTLKNKLVEHVLALRERGISVILVEHDMSVIGALADRVVCMANGRKIADGTPSEIVTNQLVIDAYLGTPRPRAGSNDDSAHPLAGTVERGGPSTVRVTPPTLPAADGHQEQSAAGANDRSPLFVAESMRVGYGSHPDVLHDCSLVVRTGEVVAIIGPNGAGKSTIFKGIYGPGTIRSGVVEFDGTDLRRSETASLASIGLGYVPQVANVFPKLTVEENLRVGLAGGKRGSFLRNFSTLKETFPALESLLDRRAGLLSGGERQMLAMGRALMASPKMLLLDEPSAGLSPALQDQVFEMIESIASAGVTILVVEQNARRCLEISDRGYVLDQGRNSREGTGAELLADPEIVELYLGGLRSEGTGASQNSAV